MNAATYNDPEAREQMLRARGGQHWRELEVRRSAIRNNPDLIDTNKPNDYGCIEVVGIALKCPDCNPGID